jgi:hypothetical protein
MFRKLYFLIIAGLIFFNISFAQSFLTHNTGVLQASVFSNGYIGHNFDGSVGNGVKFGAAPDAMFTAGLFFGNLNFGVNGMVGSFVQGTPQVPIIADMQNTSPLTPFTSDPNFNQITEAVMNDGLSPTPYNISVKQKSYSNTNDKFVFLTYELTNNSAQTIPNFRVGIFSDWDVGATSYLNNRRGIDVSRNLVYQYLVGAADVNYYGFVALNGLTGGTSTDFFPGDGTTIRFEVYNLINAIYDSTLVTRVGDYRSYSGSGPYSFNAGATLFVSFAIVVGTNLADLQATADAAILKYNGTFLPVELSSFSANVSNGNILLDWTTETEINNQGFEIQRRNSDGQFVTIGNVQGNGTTTERKQYSYTDAGLETGNYYYRLKQIDFGGAYEYSKEIFVEVTAPLEFALNQNYPNPFNPTTIINFSLAEPSFVKLAIYNLMGEEVRILKNEYMSAGNFNATFDAASLPSGMYLYKIETAQYSSVRKMMLMK